MKRPVNSTSVSICSSDDGTCTNTKTNDYKIKRTICKHIANANTAKTHQQYAGSHQHAAKLALCKYLYPHKISKIHHLSAYCQPARSSAYCQTRQRRTIMIPSGSLANTNHAIKQHHEHRSSQYSAILSVPVQHHDETSTFASTLPTR